MAWQISFLCFTKGPVRRDQRFLTLPCSGRSVKLDTFVHSEPVFLPLLSEAEASSMETGEAMRKKKSAGAEVSFVRPDGLSSIPLKILIFFFLIPSSPCLSVAPLSLLPLFLSFLLLCFLPCHLISLLPPLFKSVSTPDGFLLSKSICFAISSYLAAQVSFLT